MEIHVFDQDFNFIGIVDSYTSSIWTPHFNTCGDFELYLPASCEMVTLLQEDYYLVRSTDIRVVDNVTTYKNVMIIKNITINTDVENGDYLTVTGKELKFILNQRIVWKMTTLIGNVAECIYKLLNENAIKPSDSARVLPYLTLDAIPDNITEAITKQFTGNKLDAAIEELCLAYGLGYEVYVVRDSGVISMPFRLYKGVNRSYAQKVRPCVVFSSSHNNLYNTEYILNTEAYSNVALIGGEGEGTQRTYTSVGAATGLDRYELFVDAKDVSSTDNPDVEVITADLAKAVENKQAEVDAKQAQITAQAEVVSTLQTELAKAEDELKKNQVSIAEKESVIAQLNNQLTSLKANLNGYLQRYNQLTKELNVAKKNKDENKITELNKVLSDLVVTIERTKVSINETTNNINTEYDNLNKLKNDRGLLTDEINTVNGKLNTAQRTLGVLMQELNTLNNQLTSLTNQYNNATKYAYIELLKENGREKLSEASVIEEFNGEVLADISYKLGEDYKLGDIVSVVSEYGVTANSRILSIIESVGENGSVTIVPNFGTWEV